LEDAKKIVGVTTTLDRLEFGPEDYYEQDLAKPKKERKAMPAGITRSMLSRDILRIAWPSLIELFLASLVNMVDTMMVGRIVGTEALSAVGLATQPKFIYMSMIAALNTGCTALIARARGAGQHDKANDILRQSLMFCAAMAVVCAVVGVSTALPLIRFMANGGMPDNILRDSAIYLQIQMALFPVSALAFTITAALRGTGNSKPPMVYNIVANLVNILFNWILIGGNLGAPALGVAGASIATVIGQCVGTVMAFRCVLSGKYYLKFKLKNLLVFEKDVLKGLVTVGIPAMVEQLIMRAGVMIFTRMVAGLGTIQYSTHEICLNIQSMSFMLGQAFATSATSLVGQSLGRCRLDMAYQYGKSCQRLGLIVACILGVLLCVFRRYLVMLYSTEEEVIALGSSILFFIAFLQPFQSQQFILGGALRGAGDTKAVAVYMVITVLIILTLTCYLFVNILGMGLYGAWIAQALNQCARTGLFTLRYDSGKWKKIRLLAS